MGRATTMFYKVLYDFTAEEDIEISVQRGEYVRLINSVVQDGWIRVEVCAEPTRRGFVPASYLKQEMEPKIERDCDSALDFQHASVQASVRMRDALDVCSLPKQYDRLDSSRTSIPSHEESGVRGTLKSSALNVSPSEKTAERGPGEIPGNGMIHDSLQERSYSLRYADHFSVSGEIGGKEEIDSQKVSAEHMKRKAYFRQLMKQRTDLLEDVRTLLRDALAAVSTCEGKAVLLSQKLSEFDQTMGKEQL